CLVLASALALADPVAAVSASVTEATGVAGDRPTAELVGAAVATAWPTVAVVGGVLIVAAGVLVLATGTRWAGSSRRYRSGLEPADGSQPAQRGAAERAVDDWDELSRGDDPTDDAVDDAEASTDPADDTADTTVDPADDTTGPEPTR
ncbi:MAG TPA: Trp biosynthesis-associated membrane protein, partial [Agromyces sp.]